jgi:hypothetical protein
MRAFISLLAVAATLVVAQDVAGPNDCAVSSNPNCVLSSSELKDQRANNLTTSWASSKEVPTQLTADTMTSPACATMTSVTDCSIRFGRSVVMSSDTVS